MSAPVGAHLDQRDVELPLCAQPDDGGSCRLGEGAGDQDDAHRGELLGVQPAAVLVELGQRVLVGDRRVAEGAAQVVRVAGGEGLDLEPGCVGGVLDGLHLDGVGGAVALELGEDEPPVLVEAQQVQPVGVGAGSGHPLVELVGHDAHAGAEDLRVQADPLLQVRPLFEPGLGQRDPPRDFRAAGMSSEDHLAAHVTHRA